MTVHWTLSILRHTQGNSDLTASLKFANHEEWDPWNLSWGWLFACMHLGTSYIMAWWFDSLSTVLALIWDVIGPCWKVWRESELWKWCLSHRSEERWNFCECPCSASARRSKLYLNCRLANKCCFAYQRLSPSLYKIKMSNLRIRMYNTFSWALFYIMWINKLTNTYDWW